MHYAIQPATAPINAQVVIPGSKSITNRALLLAALAQGASTLSGVLFSDDTWVFINALTALGVKLMPDVARKSCIVHGVDGKFPQRRASIDCQNAGTAARFLLAACAIMPGEFYFDGTPRLRERPLAALLQILAAQGAKLTPVKATNMPFTISGAANKIIGGEIFAPGDKSSQFLSALLMIAPFAQAAVTLRTRELISQPYVAMTCAMMREFGVQVAAIAADAFEIAVPQNYQAQNYVIEPDLSTASYFFAAAAITGGVITVANIDRANCKQGDIQFLTILEMMGCQVENPAQQIIVRGAKKLSGVVVDMRDISDTFMTLACLAPFADKPTTINNIAHVRLQESDRIEAVAANLKNVGIKVDASHDSITIYPGSPTAGFIDSFADHRIAMAFSLLGLLTPGIVINDIQCVSKTCPDFVQLWESILL